MRPIRITSEEKKGYSKFIQDQLQALTIADVNDENILWHYTTADAFLKLINSGALYATQVSCLNDSSEIQYGMNLLRDAFIDIQTDTKDEKDFLSRIIKAIVEGPAASANLVNCCFVICFSGKRDDLSQWRAYSGGENGYA
jgi:hypothetical protein